MDLPDSDRASFAIGRRCLNRPSFRSIPAADSIGAASNRITSAEADEHIKDPEIRSRAHFIAIRIFCNVNLTIV